MLYHFFAFLFHAPLLLYYTHQEIKDFPKVKARYEEEQRLLRIKLNL